MKTKVFLDFEKLKNLNSGLGQFCTNLGEGLVNCGKEEFRFEFYLPEKMDQFFGQEHQYKFVKPWHKLYLNSQNNNIWHCTHQTSKYWPRKGSGKTLLTIHDLNFLYKKRSNLYYKRYLNDLQRKIDRADAISVISVHTLNEIKKHLHIAENKLVKVIYNGNSLKSFPLAKKPAYVPECDFIFSIGIINSKKNFHVLLPLLRQNPQLNLVIAGSNNHKYAKEIVELARDLKVEKRLIMPGAVSDEDKYWLYKNCTAFVFPSISEGFGLPVIEAMSLGKPVFLSRLTSLPEVGGEEAFYWDSFDAEEMAKVFYVKMKEFQSDQETYSKRIRTWASRFSWEVTAKEYIDLYREVLT